MTSEDRAELDAAAKTKTDEYVQNLSEFKKTDNWRNFVRAAKRPVKKAMKKSKVASKGPPQPRKPEGMPQRPLDAFKQFCKDQGERGVKAADLAKMFQDLSEEEKTQKQAEARERTEEYEQKQAEFDKSPAGKKYQRDLQNFVKRKRITEAKARFLKDEPKKPQSAYFIFMNDKREELARDFPDIKGLGPVNSKLAEMWSNVTESEKEVYTNKEKEAREEHLKQMEQYQQSPNYKRYMAVVNKANGVGKKKQVAKVVTVPKPDNLPKKPQTAFFLYLSEQRKDGNGGNPSKLQEAWRNLGAEGQKEYNDKVVEMNAQYEKELKEFTKSAEGKKYFRLKAALDKKNRLAQARSKFLGAEAANEPKRPQSAYFVFVQEKRSSMPPGKVGDIAKQLTEMWSNLAPEEKKTFEDRANELKQKYEKDMAEYKSSATFKKYDRVVKAIQGKGKPKARAGGKAGKAGKVKGAAAAKGKARASAPAKTGGDSDSDSDVMGSDSDDSSSDSDSD